MDKPLTTTYVTFPSTPWNWFQHPRLWNTVLRYKPRQAAQFLGCFYDKNMKLYVIILVRLEYLDACCKLILAKFAIFK